MTFGVGRLLLICQQLYRFWLYHDRDRMPKAQRDKVHHLAILILLLLRGKDETPDIEDLGSVLRDSSIQTLRLPTQFLSYYSSLSVEN
jgi:hypothetical protein